ncbi:MAG: hypothetical protein HOQ11_03255 [Gemmatimonadaceae bacterium]|nr:hypothetical protein [Gemmatimonadaceae bacterium]NUQ93125.1 hypothetical protein [Gemmatimonadaceae bacterium]NUR19092.1 hypothetical protein [Gemmatimonadaceae bacterium]NUS96407.1 hypothetical protein [Gemmatimonadaceae bacterium]
MPVAYDFTNGVLRLTTEGASAPADVAAAMDAAIADDACPALRGLLLDARGSTTAARRSSLEIRAIAENVASQADRFGGRLALLAQTDVVYGLMRMGEVWVQAGGRVRSRVFRDEGEALAWLAPGGAEGDG